MLTSHCAETFFFAELSTLRFFFLLFAGGRNRQLSHHITSAERFELFGGILRFDGAGLQRALRLAVQRSGGNGVGLQGGNDHSFAVRANGPRVCLWACARAHVL